MLGVIVPLGRALGPENNLVREQGLTIGHTDDQLTLPLGPVASLDADKGELAIEEPALV